MLVLLRSSVDVHPPLQLTLHAPVTFCRPPEVVHDTDGLGSGCVLCHEPDFLRGAFGDRTIMICDTCEREFHVGCLRDYGRADLKEVSYSSECCCTAIYSQLVYAGVDVLPATHLEGTRSRYSLPQGQGGG